jgi:hypothetical protein
MFVIFVVPLWAKAKLMADTKNEHTWHWQEPGTAWKGICIYHLTLTIPTRKPLLGTLHIPNNDPKKATVQRTNMGEQLVEMFVHLPYYYPELRILQFCLMPDHMHAIIYVTQPMKKSFNMVARSILQGAKKIGRAYSLSISPELNSGLINEGLKQGLINGNGMVQRDASKGEELYYGDPIFTEMPFIRPLSRRGQMHSMINYVRNNPQRLATKRLMPGFFRVQEGIEIAGRTYSGVGNVHLLQSKHFAPVHVRNMWVRDAEQHGNTKPLRDYMNACVLSARKGITMVSPFISPKEREVMRVLLQEKHPFIVLSDNGFRDYYKPSDVLFDAVADGRVLILSPWEYDPNKRHISREDCVALNGMAEEISKV